MDVRGIKIETVLGESGHKFETTYETPNMVDESGNHRPEFVNTLLKCVDSAMEFGTIITIKPILSFEDEFEVAWNRMCYDTQIVISALMATGKNIGAVKRLREETGWGLKDARRMIDSEWIWTKIKEVI